MGLTVGSSPFIINHNNNTISDSATTFTTSSSSNNSSDNYINNDNYNNSNNHNENNSSASNSTPHPPSLPSKVITILSSDEEGDKENELSCEKRNYESNTSSELANIYIQNKARWVRAIRNNLLIKKWQYAIPLHAFGAKVSLIMKKTFFEGFQEDDDPQVYSLSLMWDEISNEMEKMIGDGQINFLGWLTLLACVESKHYARVPFNQKSFNFFMNVIFCVLGPKIG